MFHDSAIHPANCSQSHTDSNKFEERFTHMPYVRMDAKPQGDHWEAHNAHAELKKEKREYKFAICVFKRKGMGSRTFKLTINLQQANAQLFLPRIAIKSVEWSSCLIHGQRQNRKL